MQYPTSMKNFFPFIFLFLACSLSFSQRQPTIDSLLNRLNRDKDSTRVNTLNALVLAYRMNNPQKSFQYSKESIALAEKLNFKKGIADAFHVLGILNSNQGDYDKALKNYFDALKIREEIHDTNGIGASNNNIGLVLWNQGKLMDALKYYLTSLKIDEDSDDKDGMATSYNNIGIIYWTLGSYDKGLEYFIKAMKVYEHLGNKEGLAGVCCNIGGIYFNKKDIETSLGFFHKSVKIYEEINDKRGIGQAYLNISEAYAEKKEFNKCLEYQQKALEIQEENGDKFHLAHSFTAIGKTYLNMKKAAPAIAYLNKGLEITSEIGVPKLRSETFKILAEAYKLKGDFPSALAYQEKYISLKDSVLNEDANKQVSEMEAKYQNEMKGNKIELLNKENELKIVELHREKFVRNSFIAGFILVLILSIAIYRSFRQKKKMNSLLSEKNIIIEQKNKDITDSIEYAKTLQDAILPDIETVTNSIPGSFIFFRPRDIVSGDFYWFHKRNNTCFIIAADCTGHGVPGAFVSMACNNILNDVIIRQNIDDPGNILTEVNRRVCEAFKKEGSKAKTNDGMDVSLIKLSFSNSASNSLIGQHGVKMEYAGAMNPALVARNNELIELPADKMPIGGFTKTEYPFKTQKLELLKDDAVYIFSDGFHDQFGGQKGKKFLFRRFKETLLKISPLNADKQLAELENVLLTWQGGLERVDDVLVIGIKL